MSIEDGVNKVRSLAPDAAEIGAHLSAAKEGVLAADSAHDRAKARLGTVLGLMGQIQEVLKDATTESDSSHGAAREALGNVAAAYAKSTFLREAAGTDMAGVADTEGLTASITDLDQVCDQLCSGRLALSGTVNYATTFASLYDEITEMLEKRFQKVDELLPEADPVCHRNIDDGIALASQAQEGLKNFTVQVLPHHTTPPPPSEG